MFKFPLQIGVMNDGKLKLETVLVDERSTTFEIMTDQEPDSLMLDPEMWLLFEEVQ